MALPIPVPPPVTIATLWLNKPGLKTLDADIFVSWRCFFFVVVFFFFFLKPRLKLHVATYCIGSCNTMFLLRIYIIAHISPVSFTFLILDCLLPPTLPFIIHSLSKFMTLPFNVSHSVLNVSQLNNTCSFSSHLQVSYTSEDVFLVKYGVAFRPVCSKHYLGKK